MVKNPKSAIRNPQSKIPTDDLTRLRAEYAHRKHRLSGNDLYSPFNLANLFTLQQRQRNVLNLLRRNGFYPLKDHRILELGCGSGGVLLEFLTYGADSTRLPGTDLLPDRIVEAHVNLPHLPLICADGQTLPYTRESFDLVLQYTVFSSILDHTVKTNLAREMLRVLRKPRGMIPVLSLSKGSGTTSGSTPPTPKPCPGHCRRAAAYAPQKLVLSYHPELSS